ncbi:MAG: glycosyltransferase family 4 protein [Elusimicrobia bacterium]|nr:glycosyltransferase family 4 protein [Elusimicrobiota bacterium]
MNILLITQDFPNDERDVIVSGAVKNPFYLSRALTERGHRLTIVSFDRISSSKAPRDPGAPPVRRFHSSLKLFFRTLWLNTRSFPHLLHLAKRHDVIQSHHPHYTVQVAAMKALRLIRTPLIVKAHGTAVPELRANEYKGIKGFLLNINARFNLLFDRFVLRTADITVSSSRYQLFELGTLYKARPDRLSMIRNGYPESLYDKVEKVPRPIGSAFALLFVGRIVPKKGIAYFIDLVRQVNKTRKARGQLILGRRLGIEDQGLYKTHIAPLAGDTTFNVRFDVQDREMPSIYAAADVLIVPSRGYESIPTVVYEALAVGTPVFPTGDWGIPEIIPPPYHLSGNIERDAAHLVDELSKPYAARRPVHSRGENGWRARAIEFEKLYAGLAAR